MSNFQTASKPILGYYDSCSSLFSHYEQKFSSLFLSLYLLLNVFTIYFNLYKILQTFLSKHFQTSKQSLSLKYSSENLDARYKNSSDFRYPFSQISSKAQRTDLFQVWTFLYIHLFLQYFYKTAWCSKHNHQQFQTISTVPLRTN